jgi:ribosomal protein S18 acetylase RimI-like enzyme
MNFEFKKATIGDISNMNILNTEILPENYPLLFWITKLLTSSNSYVAYNNNVLVGYCFCYPESPRSGLICSLTVHPNFRNQKVANTLLRLSIDSLKEQLITNIILHVRVDNIIAKNIYLKNGFEIKDIIKDYYGENQDAYLMNHS